MEILTDIIQHLNPEEARHYKVFIRRTNETEGRKDEALFDHYRKSKESNDDAIFRKLYPKGDKNSFYRLKNRMLEDLSKSLEIQHFKSISSGPIYNFLLLSRLFSEKNLHQVSLYFLKRAEKKAIEIENLELLEIIYGELVRLSQDILEINPEEYIQKGKENRNNLTRLKEIDDILAVINYRLKRSQNFAKADENINDVLKKIIDDFSQTNESNKSPQLRLKVYQSVSKILLQQQNFVELEKYLLKTFNEFESEHLFNKSTHETKLQMLTYIMNSLFKNDKYTLSLDYGVKLKNALDEFNGILKEKFNFYYYNSMVNNYTRINVEKAIEILEEARGNKFIQNNPVHLGYVYLNLALSYFDQRNYSQALKNLVKLYIQDTFKSLDDAFRFKIIIGELIIRYELNDTEYILQRLTKLPKEFKNLYKEKSYQRDIDFLKLLNKISDPDSILNAKGQRTEMEKFLEKEKKIKAEKNEIINYSNWILTHLNR